MVVERQRSTIKEPTKVEEKSYRLRSRTDNFVGVYYRQHDDSEEDNWRLQRENQVPKIIFLLQYIVKIFQSAVSDKRIRWKIK